MKNYYVKPLIKAKELQISAILGNSINEGHEGFVPDAKNGLPFETEE